MIQERASFRVGVNVFVVRDGKILLGKRKNVFGDGMWALPGGHLEDKEKMIEAGLRELAEETGVIATKLTFVALVNNPQNSNGHYIQTAFLAEDAQGEPEVKEPDKCYEWQWFSLSALPENVFNGHEKLIELFRDNSGHFADK